MGSFYTNITVKGASREALLEDLKRNSCNAVVGPSLGGWCTFSEEGIDMQDQERIRAFLKWASSRYGGVALSVLCHDDAVLEVQLFKQGEQISHYNSCPGYFLEDPTDDQMNPVLENAGNFAAEFDAVSEKDLEHILMPDAGTYLYPLDVQSELWRILQLPEYGVGFGFRYAQHDTDEYEPERFARTN